MLHEHEEHLCTSFAQVILVSVFIDHVDCSWATVSYGFTEVRLHLETFKAELYQCRLSFYPFVRIHTLSVDDVFNRFTSSPPCPPSRTLELPAEKHVGAEQRQ